jgi:hypothetical protein
MTIAMTAPTIRPQTPYLIFPAVSGFIDNSDIFAYDDLATNELDEVIGPGQYRVPLTWLIETSGL